MLSTWLTSVAGPSASPQGTSRLLPYCFPPAAWRGRIAAACGPAADQLDVRPAKGREELAQAAALRAEAYYEENTFSSPDNNSEVVGTLDLRPPAAATGVPPPSVPETDDLAAFMTNVSVGEDSRGQGIGKALLEESILKAKTSWGTSRIFAFVDSDNEAALGLYKRFGFKEIKPDLEKLTMPHPHRSAAVEFVRKSISSEMRQPE
ncbi:hypothetical protein WJX74_007087 [Apatococcus lobatus]|uniref:N-acetyltransferase domain-containing protein n=1 Tax=Apatococcus lobatus TaxID=904363 RepID=A0AAW1QHZ4_9CHLO